MMTKRVFSKCFRRAKTSNRHAVNSSPVSNSFTLERLEVNTKNSHRSIKEARELYIIDAMNAFLYGTKLSHQIFDAVLFRSGGVIAVQSQLKLV